MFENAIKGISSTTSKSSMNVHRIIEYAGTIHKDREVVTLTEDGVFRYTYGEMLSRIKQLSSALKKRGVKAGDAVTVFGSNTHTTVEALYAIIGLGATAFTANVRIPFEHLLYCLNHVSANAPNKVAVLEPEHIDLVQKLCRETDQKFDDYIILGNRTDNPSPPPFDSCRYSEELIPQEDPTFHWEEIHEDTAAVIMFTTGTSGRPKPLAHSHRMMWLHSVGMCASLGIGALDNVLILPAVYHLGWLLWVEAPFMGAKMVLPGKNPNPKDYVDLILNEKVSFTAAVPTIFSMMLEDFKARDCRLNNLTVYFAGQSAPPNLIREYDSLGANARQLYGFSECGPHFVENAPRIGQEFRSDEEYATFKATVAGFCCCGADINVFDEDGTSLPWDGSTPGTIGFRALWASTEYWNDSESTSAGRIGSSWLQVGDIGTIDPQGYVKVLDRIKDAVKSGGEWIPSPQVEAAITNLDGVDEAAVIGAHHPKWMERPIAVIKPAEGAQDLTREQVKEFLINLVDQGKFNKYWIPDEVIITDDIPKTSVGKYDKKVLRERYKDVLTKGR